MPLTTRSTISLVTAILLTIVAGCSDDPVTPAPTEHLEIDLVSSYTGDTPDAALMVHIEANLPLERVVFKIDGQEAVADSAAPFQFLWNIGLYADDERHYLSANGYATGDRDDYDSISLYIPTGTGGVLVAPALAGGLAVSDEAPLRWLRDPHVSDYEVALSLLPDFSSVTHTATTTDTCLVVPATADQWQYWRVRGRADDDTWRIWSENGLFFGGAVFDREYLYSGYESAFGRAVLQTDDGGFLVAGWFHRPWPFVRRLDSLGDTVWAWEPYFRGEYRDMVLTDDGGCVLVGTADGDLILTRLDEDGREIWSRPHFGSDDPDAGHRIVRCAAGGYIVAGSRDGVAWLLRVDDDGRLLWQETYENCSAAAVVEAPGGGFVFTGDAYYRDVTVLVGCDADGNELWRTILDGSDTVWGFAGVDLLAGESGFTVLDGNRGLHRFDADGRYETTTWLEGGDYVAIEAAGDGGCFVAANFGLLRLDESGQELWRGALGGTPQALCLCADGGFAVTGFRRNNYGHMRLWVQKMNADGASAPPILD